MPRKMQVPPGTYAKPKPKVRKRIFQRQGTVTQPERDFVAQFVADQPRPVSPEQEKALGVLLRRAPATIKALVEDARERFVASAADYVDIHKQATQSALDHGDNDVAAKAAQWALTSISAEGARIVDKPDAEVGGAKVLIGIRVGGINSGAVALPLIAAPAEPHE